MFYPSSQVLKQIKSMLSNPEELKKKSGTRETLWPATNQYLNLHKHWDFCSKKLIVRIPGLPSDFDAELQRQGLDYPSLCGSSFLGGN